VLLDPTPYHGDANRPLSAHRLLEVFRKLESVAAASSDEAAQLRLVDEAQDIIQDICHDHTLAVESFIRDAELKKTLGLDLQNECDLLKEYIMAARRFRLEVNSRSKDRVVSFGEKLSCRFMVSLLRDRVRRPARPS